LQRRLSACGRVVDDFVADALLDDVPVREDRSFAADDDPEPLELRS
jgi:hypothetical protein